MQATAMGAAVMLGAIVVLARTPASTSVIAQAAPSTPIPLAPPALHSPEVDHERRVTFTITTPNAKTVSVAIEGSTPRPMLKDEKGVWTLTTGQLEPDYHGYSFAVDGSRAFGSANAGLVPNLLNPRSLLHVRGDRSLPWEVNDVPHGAVRRHVYKSSIADDTRDLYVYTPPGYETSTATRYPVLYLLHGFSDDASAWTSVGMANVILDNLIARRTARPMIVAMPLGYGTPEIVHAAERTPGMGRKNVERFSEMMFAEIIPQVERLYRVDGNRRARAIAGLSMGGSESLVIGLNHLDTFASVAGFSAGLREGFEQQFPDLTASANTKLEALWIACGTDDRLIKINRKFKAWLAWKQIKFTDVETAGDHTWMVWRRNLAAFAPLLFRIPNS